MSSSFYSEHTVKGRRDYVCQFCGRGIAKGALHVYPLRMDGEEIFFPRCLA